MSKPNLEFSAYVSDRLENYIFYDNLKDILCRDPRPIEAKMHIVLIEDTKVRKMLANEKPDVLYFYIYIINNSYIQYHEDLKDSFHGELYYFIISNLDEKVKLYRDLRGLRDDLCKFVDDNYKYALFKDLLSRLKAATPEEMTRDLLTFGGEYIPDRIQESLSVGIHIIGQTIWRHGMGDFTVGMIKSFIDDELKGINKKKYTKYNLPECYSKYKELVKYVNIFNALVE